MKLGIMQPYFFPYLGYFDLINRTDRWIVFDTAQYIYHGWIDRNRILHPNSGWQYVKVPLKKHSRGRSAIKDVEISGNVDWKGRIIAQLGHYKKKARYYREIVEWVEACLDEKESRISRLNVNVMKHVCRRLGIDFYCEVFSEMDIDLGPVEGRGDWALRICEATGATEYLNPPGGADLFSREAFASSGITLRMQEFQNMEYDCRRWEFIPALSIIDVMMWNTPREIRAHLNSER